MHSIDLIFICIIIIAYEKFIIIDMYQLSRIQQVQFDFTLETFYRRGIVESDRATTAEYNIEIVMENKLHRGYVSVDLRIDNKLERFCTSTLRGCTILDVFVLVFAIVILILYIISVLRMIKVLKVCM